MDKDKILQIAKENKKQLIITAIGIVISVVLQLFDDGGFWDGLGILTAVATIIYASVAVYGIINKAKEELAAKELAEKKAAEEKAAIEEKEKEEKAIEEFKATFDTDAQIDYIFSTIKENLTINSFEQGLDSIIKKTNTTVDKSLLRKIVLEALLKRVENGDKNIINSPSTIIISNYFSSNLKNILMDDYVIVAQTDKHINVAADYTEAQIWRDTGLSYRISFVKNLYGFAVRAWNYSSFLENKGEYIAITDAVLAQLIDTDSVIKSYCEANPFEADEKKQEWLEALRKAAYKAANRGSLDLDVKEEKLLDMLCYISYTLLTGNGGKDVTVIANDLLSVIKPVCEELIQRAG